MRRIRWFRLFFGWNPRWQWLAFLLFFWHVLLAMSFSISLRFKYWIFGAIFESQSSINVYSEHINLCIKKDRIFSFEVDLEEFIGCHCLNRPFLWLRRFINHINSPFCTLSSHSHSHSFCVMIVVAKSSDAKIDRRKKINASHVRAFIPFVVRRRQQQQKRKK